MVGSGGLERLGSFSGKADSREVALRCAVLDSCGWRVAMGREILEVVELWSRLNFEVEGVGRLRS